MQQKFFLTFLILFSSCSSGPSKKNLEIFDKKIEDEKLTELKNILPSQKTRQPLKKGQWVKVVTNYKGENSDKKYLTYKVLDAKGKSVLMEIESLNASTLQMNVLQYEIEHYPLTHHIVSTTEEMMNLVEKMKIKKILMKNGESPIEQLPSAYMPMAKNLLKTLFISGTKVGEIRKEKCSSEYLASTTCYIFDYKANLFNQILSGTTYGHSEIPIIGFVKSISQDFETQVINYGLKGAKSALLTHSK